MKTARCFTSVSQAEIFLVNDPDFRSIRSSRGDSLSRTNTDNRRLKDLPNRLITLWALLEDCFYRR